MAGAEWQVRPRLRKKSKCPEFLMRKSMKTRKHSPKNSHVSNFLAPALKLQEYLTVKA